MGKFNLHHMVSKNPIVGGGGEETFLHGAFAGPVTGIVPPYLLGGGIRISNKDSPRISGKKGRRTAH